jgi:hypothetical protein
MHSQLHAILRSHAAAAPTLVAVSALASGMLVVPPGHAQSNAAMDAAMGKMLELGNVQMAEPSPELPGDRAKSCEQLGLEMRSIMKRRGFDDSPAATAKACAARQANAAAYRDVRVLVETEGRAAAAAANTAAAATMYAPNAVRDAAVSAATAGFEAKAKAKGDQAGQAVATSVNQDSFGTQATMQAMNDPRIMRIMLLSEEKNCGEVQPPAGPSEDPCTGEIVAEGALPSDLADAVGYQTQGGKPVKTPLPGAAPTAPAGSASDPFAPKAPPAKPANDPFAR